VLTQPLGLALALALAFAVDAQAQQSYAPLNFSARPSAAKSAATTPALPFRYVGRLIQNGKSEVLILRGNRLYSVAEGDEIDGEYRVERITGASVQFTYLPEHARQSLDLTAAR